MRKISSESALDSPERTEEHRQIIAVNTYLNKVYRSWYEQFVRESQTLPSGLKLELGSGGGFIKDIIPDMITSDVLEISGIDKIIDARNLPFENQTLAGIFMINVLHHIPQIDSFFREADRVLIPGGKIIMIEPANTALSSFIYRKYHHELFDTSLDWSFPESGPLSGSNQALPWIIFERDYPIFRKKYPTLHLLKRWNHTPFNYIISGGVSRSPLLPSSLFNLVRFVEKYPLLPFRNLLSLFQTIIVEKK
ncbi:MAG: class I SAM-dependent methyltransferase [Saprospiraceae bacterium]|nr:class I SAM-dependent methyltransferase [Saprospiraceae bacterium]